MAAAPSPSAATAQRSCPCLSGTSTASTSGPRVRGPRSVPRDPWQRARVRPLTLVVLHSISRAAAPQIKQMLEMFKEEMES